MTESASLRGSKPAPDRYLTRTWCPLLVVALWMQNAAGALESFPDDHPALRLYPSPSEWRARIDEAKRVDRERFEAARADIDLAIRTSVLLKDEKPWLISDLPHSKDKSLLRRSSVLLPENVESIIRQVRARNDEKAAETEAWWLKNLDALTVANSEMLKIAVADLLLNDWTDWTEWENTEVLQTLRAECPAVHRYHACRIADKLNTNEFNVIFLRWIVDAHRPKGIDVIAVSHPLGGGSGMEVLDFLLRASSLEDVRDLPVSPASIAEHIQPSPEETPRCRDLWAEHLSSSDAIIRAHAVLQTGDMVRRMRIYSKGQDNSEGLQNRLEQIRDTDPDPSIRSYAKDRLESIRTAEWSEDP